MLSQKQTSYPTSSIDDLPIGNIDRKSLDTKLKILEKKEREKDFILSYDSQHWSIKLADLGLNIADQKIEKQLFAYNKEKIKTLFNQKNNPLKIEPVFNVDQTACIKLLNNTISIDQTPINASIELTDNNVTTTKESDGVLLNTSATCQTIEKMLNSKNYESTVETITLPAQIKSNQYSAIIQKIKQVISSPITLVYREKKWIISPEEILALIDFDHQTDWQKINWGENKLDELVNKITQEIGAANPNKEICQKNQSAKILASDKLKLFIKGLENDTERTYILETSNDDKSPKSDLKLGSGTIYLTFDDGLTHGDTIMDYADCYDIKITFFEIAARAKTDTKQLIRAVNEGHAVESHGFLHAVYDYGTGHSYGWQYNDILSSINILKNITGKRPKFFRPPGGNKTKDTYAAAAAAGVKLILWNISSIDTKPIPASEICHNVLSHAKNNGVVLMHSTHSETAKAVPCIIEGLLYKGYALKALE